MSTLAAMTGCGTTTDSTPTSSSSPSGTASAPSSASMIALSGALQDTVTATSGPVCLSTHGGNSPVNGASESDWSLNHAGSAEGILTWYTNNTSDRTISLATYDFSLTMSVDSHDLNGISGTVAQSHGGHEIRFDVSLNDPNNSAFVVRAVGDLTC